MASGRTVTLVTGDNQTERGDATTPMVVSGTLTQGTASATESWLVNLNKVNGTAFSLGQQLAAASLPVVLATDIALPAGTNAIGKLSANSGINIGDVVPIPATSGGLSTFHLVSAATTNATNVKASAGQLYGWYIYNSNATARKVAFHNNAGTPTAGASVVFSIVIPGLTAANVFTDLGISFATGIAITMVTGLADSDAVAVAANDLICNLFYK